MTKPSERFRTQTNKLRELLAASINQKEVAVGFYKSKARDTIFRLEALCRIYREINDRKFFDLWYKKFKRLEDMLGDLDHAESMLMEFSGYPVLKKSALTVYGAAFDEAANKLGTALLQDGWLDGSAIESFASGCDNANWLNEDDDAVAFGTAMCLELDKLVMKYKNGELDMFRLEEGIHEFRRRLRWVSIYAGAANGLVQLRPVAVSVELKPYCIKEITSSPFNVLPAATETGRRILIQSTYFYAMSWMINHLGLIKDSGLRNEAFGLICAHAGVRDKKVRTKFETTLKVKADQVHLLAEQSADKFVYVHFIPERIRRDIKRSIA